MRAMCQANRRIVARSAQDTRGPILITMPAISGNVGRMARTSARVMRAGMTKERVFSPRLHQ
jgi:hypothetical protein